MKDYENLSIPQPTPLTIITWVSIFGLLSMLPPMIILSPSYLKNFNLYLQIPERIWLGIIYLVLFATVLANVMLVKGISLIKASRTAIFANLIAIVAIILSAIFLAEKIDPVVDFLSFFLIVFGIILVNRKQKQINGKVLTNTESFPVQV